MDDATEKGLKYQAQYYRTKKKNTKLGEEVTTLLESIQDLKKEFAFNDETMHVLCCFAYIYLETLINNGPRYKCRLLAQVV